jgi:hypothetical protein
MQQFSRRYAWLRLAIAVPLIVIIAYVGYDRYVKDDGTPGDGWKTYRNERYGYELRYPSDWQIIEESDYPAGSGNETIDIQYVIFARDKVDPSRPGIRPRPHVFAAVNFQGGWCESTKRIDIHDVTVSGTKGTEYICFLGAELVPSCEPNPQCADEPWTVLRRFERNGVKFQVWGDANPGAFSYSTPNFAPDQRCSDYTDD